MRILKTPQFHKWQKKTSISDFDLIKAIREIESGLVDAKLGGDVYKKRLAVDGGGKSSGARTIVAVKSETRSVYIVGYFKNEMDNISKKELGLVKSIAKALLAATDEEIDHKIQLQQLFEVKQ